MFDHAGLWKLDRAAEEYWEKVNEREKVTADGNWLKD